MSCCSEAERRAERENVNKPIELLRPRLAIPSPPRGPKPGNGKN